MFDGQSHPFAGIAMCIVVAQLDSLVNTGGSP